MGMLEFVTLTCPYCGESFETNVDLSAGSQRYIEDCAICCRPIEVALTIDDENQLVNAHTTTDRD